MQKQHSKWALANKSHTHLLSHTHTCTSSTVFRPLFLKQWLHEFICNRWLFFLIRHLQTDKSTGIALKPTRAPKHFCFVRWLSDSSFSTKCKSQRNTLRILRDTSNSNKLVLLGMTTISTTPPPPRPLPPKSASPWTHVLETTPDLAGNQHGI